MQFSNILEQTNPSTKKSYIFLSFHTNHRPLFFQTHYANLCRRSCLCNQRPASTMAAPSAPHKMINLLQAGVWLSGPPIRLRMRLGRGVRRRYGDPHRVWPPPFRALELIEPLLQPRGAAFRSLARTGKAPHLIVERKCFVQLRLFPFLCLLGFDRFSVLISGVKRTILFFFVVIKF